jgi:hypothetical protein
MADEKWLDDLKEDIIIIKETLKNMVETNNLKLIAFEEKLKVANNRIKDLEDNNRWLWRAIAGTLITAAMAFLLKK